MHVVHIITGLGDGGAEAALYRLCRASAAADPALRQSVVSLNGPGKYGPLLEAAGVEMFCPRLAGAAAMGGFRALVRRLRQERPDVVQCWMYHANLVGGAAARLAGIRNVAWGLRHSWLDPNTSRRSTRLVDWLCARLSALVPRTIVSCSARAAVDHAVLGYAAEKLIVIPNGYDVAQFAPDAAARAALRRTLRAGEGERLIGLVGRWTPDKDHANLLAALAQLPPAGTPWRLLLVGTGMEAGNRELAGLVAAAGLAGRADLLGRRDDVPAVMNALDLHVLSSASEAFPNVVAEAMACGTPCVVTDVGDAAEIVGDTGWVVPPRDPAALAEAIAAALAECGGAGWPVRQAAARARIVERFSLARMREAYLAAWTRGA